VYALSVTGLVNKMLQYYEFQFSKVRHSASQVQLTKTLQIKVANKKFRHYVDRNIKRGQVSICIFDLKKCFYFPIF